MTGVVVSPVCSRGDIDDIDDCDTAPVDGAYLEIRQDGAVVSHGQADGRGLFTMDAPEGTVVVYASREEGMMFEASSLVTIHSGQTADVELRLDLGSR